LVHHGGRQPSHFGEQMISMDQGGANEYIRRDVSKFADERPIFDLRTGAVYIRHQSSLQINQIKKANHQPYPTLAWG
jgi:hypothetical protein